MPDLEDRLSRGLTGRYRIERELGRGGMATVYLAEDLKHHRFVAIKVLRPDLSAAVGAERFLREIEIAAGLGHPHILPLHDSGEAEGLLYYTMPFVDGESLRDKMVRAKQLPVDEAVRIAREIAAALTHAHDRGVIHRDIKPENVLLASGQAVVTDFGIARAISVAGGTSLTETGLVVGTPAYMSPEQATGETDLDARTDVYALGCLLYEMLSGELPHAGATGQALLARKLSEPVRPLHPIRDSITPALDRVLRRALARTPADRYATAAEFSEALERASEADLAEVSGGLFRHRKRRWFLMAAVPLGLAVLAFWILTSLAGKGVTSSERLRVAILPLENVAGDTAEDYFVDGLTAAMIGDLAQVSSLEVISRMSVMQYKGAAKSLPEVARELNADAIVEGSAFRTDGRLRIRVQLVDGRTDATLWTREFVRDQRDASLLEGDITRALADAVDARLTRLQETRLATAATANADAYEAYLRGRYHLEPRTPEGFQEALDFFRQSLAIDPAYARAYAGLADYYRLLPFYANVTPAEAFAKARSAASKALELDGSLAEAHAALAYINAYADWNWAEAEREFVLALELNPSDADTHHAYSRLLAAVGRIPEAETEARRADALDPLSLVAHANLGIISYFARDYSRATGQLRETIELDPDFPVPYWGLALVDEQLQKYDEAIAEIGHAMDLAGRGANSLASLGHVYGVSGRSAEAEAILQEVEKRAADRHIYSYQVALVYAGLSRADEAFDWLERAYDERSPLLGYVKVDPRFDDLRDDRRFADLLHRMNLGD